MSENPPTTGSGRSRWWAVLACLALAAALDTWKLADKNIWLDEAVSWVAARRPVAEMVAITAGDVHPPGYYLVLKGWTDVFGDSPIGIRSLSVLASLIAMLLMFLLSSRALPFAVSIACLLWYALSPHTLYYGQEARMYPMATAAVLGTLVAYRAWVDSGVRNRVALAAYVAAATAALYVHYFTAFIVSAVWLHFVVLTSRSSRGDRFRLTAWRQWLVAHAAVAVLYAPWVVTAAKRLAGGQAWRATVVVSDIGAHAMGLLRQLTFGLYKAPAFGAPSSVIMWTIIGLGVIGLIVRAAIYKNERDLFFVFVTLLPIVIGLAVLPIAGNLNLSRYLAYSSPLLILSVANGLGAWRTPTPAVTALVLIAGLIPLPYARGYYSERVRDYDQRPVVAYLSGAAGADAGAGPDEILVAPGFLVYTLRYVSRDALAYRPIYSADDLKAAVARSAAAGRRAWLIADYRWPAFQDGSLRAQFDEQAVPSSMATKIGLFRLRLPLPQ